MQKFRSQDGLTLLELMTVIAIVGFVSTLGLVALRGYTRHEDTRRAAGSVANVLSRAHSEAVTGGRMTFVVFGEPTNGSLAFAPGQYAAFVIDEDGDGKIGAADAVTPIFLPNGTNADVSSYGAHGMTSMKATPLPEADESQAVPAGDLTALVQGTTIPVDPTMGVPVIAFSPQLQGTPVTPANPSAWGAGAGAVYMTDNDQMVLAVIVEPLGDVKTMVYDLSSGKWK